MKSPYAMTHATSAMGRLASQISGEAQPMENGDTAAIIAPKSGTLMRPSEPTPEKSNSPVSPPTANMARTAHRKE